MTRSNPSYPSPSNPPQPQSAQVQSALRERGAPQDAGWIDAVEETARLIHPMDQPPGYPRIRKPEMSELSEIARNELGYEREFW